MDYEKAYKAALKTATQWIKDGCTDKEKICLECVFPELRESEDERTRKELIFFLKEEIPQCSIREHADKLKAFVSYLEKQKEQKPAEWSEEDERMLSRCEKSIESSKQFADSDTFKKAKDNEIDWLENRFKSLRPSWKPSEEQMRCLCEAVDEAIRKYNSSVGGYPQAKILESLYKQLQNL